MQMKNKVENRKTIDLDSLCTSTKETPSSRMGASSISHKCMRKIWLDLHWAGDGEDITPKKQRIFSLGSWVEDGMEKYLLDLGLDLRYTGEKQIKIEIGPHFVCMPDGIIFGGVPTAEKTIHTWECKSVKKEDYDKLLKSGLSLAKPEHYTQCQCEMYAATLFLKQPVERALYTAYCKDNSEIYAERIDFDEEVLQYHLAKAEEIRNSVEMPDGIGKDPTFYICKSFCPYSAFCFVTHECRSVNCRTCIHSTPEKDGTWTCHLYEKYGWGDAVQSLDDQKEGCPYHSFLPCLVSHYPHIPECSTEDACAFEMLDGEIVLNGMGGVPSKEFLALSTKKAEEKKDMGDFADDNIPY